MLPFSKACERNQAPIGAVLARLLSPQDLVVEFGSGTGQHALYFAERFPHIQWQPTDRPGHSDIVEARVHQSELPNLGQPICFDLFDDSPPVELAQIIVAINVIHIAPWPATSRLFDHAAQMLSQGGLVYLYGPFRYAHRPLEPSNERFDQWLKDRDPLSGIRDFEAVNQVAHSKGFTVVEDCEMPANNRSIWWRLA